MRFSELPSDLGLTVIRDAPFANLGFLFDDLPDKLVFVAAPRFLTAAGKAKGVCSILTTPELASRFHDYSGLAIADDAQLAFFRIQEFLVEKTEFYLRPLPSEIHRSARVHPAAVIAAGNVSIGAESVIEANVVIERGVTIGSAVRIRAGSIIGAEGFQTAHFGQEIRQMSHGGGVIIQDGADVFANAVIARGVFRQSTLIGEGSRVGNGAFVSHNVQVGKRCFIGHNATINGNTVLGDEVWIGPNATISNMLEIGDRAWVALGSTVIESLSAGVHVTGMTALPHRRLLRRLVSIRSGHA